MSKLSGTVNKAKGRQQTKNKNDYALQFMQTRRNKIKRIQQSNGKEALEVWLQLNPVVRLSEKDLKKF